MCYIFLAYVFSFWFTHLKNETLKLFKGKNTRILEMVLALGGE